MIELVVDARPVYRHAIAVCRAVRNALPPGALSMTLQTERSHFGEARSTRLETDFWLAGAEADAVVLGVSFASKDRVWLNTVHIASPNEPTESELASGVIVKSYPLSRKPQGVN